MKEIPSELQQIFFKRNLAKNMGDLYNDNFKTLKKEIKGPKRWTFHAYGVGKNQYCTNASKRNL